MSDALTALAATVLTVLLIGVGLVVGQRYVWSMRFARSPELLDDPVPEAWRGVVRTAFPLARDLADEDFERLLKLVQLFLQQKTIEGAGGLEITDEIRLTIAAQACLLVLWLDVGLYPALRTVIVYPEAVVPKYVEAGGRIRHDPHPGAVLGQSWSMGVVILSWNSARRGALDPRDGRNVVLHEFAHQLDQEDGAADGVPVGLALSAVKPWAEMLERRFRQLRKARRIGARTVLDTYGATNEAEFFAVATEAFFEKPRRLRDKRRDLYDLLVGFYRVDPAAGLKGRDDAAPDT